ncbi:MAG: SCO family protein [Nitrososphaerota archaeon]
MRSGRSRALIAIMAALALMVVLQGCTASAGPATQVSPTVALKAGTALDPQPAPAFSLHDQSGAAVSLQQMRGHVIILTFLDATCTTECPITAQYLDWTAQFLGKDTQNVRWLAMSVNPTNTTAQAQAFMTKNAVKVPLHVLMGGQAELAPLWKAYHIQVQPGPDGDVQHTLGLYIIDAQGREREWVDGGYDPRALSADVRTLLRGGA